MESERQKNKGRKDYKFRLKFQCLLSAEYFLVGQMQMKLSNILIEV